MLPTWSIDQLTLPPPPRPAAATQAAAATTAPAGPTKVGNLKGAVAADGTFTAEAGPHQGGGVFAKVGDVTGFARVRVLPPLPWKFDFTPRPSARRRSRGSARAEILRAGTRRRQGAHQGAARRSVLPRPHQLRHAGHDNYTIQADVRSGMKEMGGQRHIPDPGVINQRYMMMLYGNHQRLQIHTWSGALATEQSGAAACSDDRRSRGSRTSGTR
jgi:hypothetical protein